MPVNPPKETPPTEKVAAVVARAGRTYSGLIAVAIAVVAGGLLDDRDFGIPALFLLILAFGLAARLVR